MDPVEGVVQLANLAGATLAGAIVGAGLMAACIAHGWYWRF